MTAYAWAVVAGDVPAGKWHRLAATRHLRDLDTAAAGGPYVFRPELADRAFRIFRLFRHYKGREWAGKPLLLEPWQAFIVGSLVGWVLRTTGLRRFRNAFVEVPRGNGKSTLAGGLLNLYTFFDDEPGAEGYSFATRKDQARISFQAARQMMLRSPALKDHVEIQKHNIHAPATESKLEPLGADADTLDGLRPQIGVADEVHKHPSGALIETIESGMGTRSQPLLFEITTAGEDVDASVYAQHYLLSTRVLDETVDLPEWFTFIAAADPDDDWTQPATWRKANPNFGVSVKPEFIEKEVRKALVNAAEQTKVRRLYLGQKLQAVDGYFSLEDWRASPGLPDALTLAAAPCYIGLDLSSSIDVTAAVVVWQLAADELAIRPVFWLPADNLDARGQRDRVPYADYVRDGWLRVTEGNTIDRVVVRQTVAALAKAHNVRAVCVDPWGGGPLMQALQDEDGITVVRVPQRLEFLSPAMKALQARVLRRRVRHDRNPLMSLMLSNVVAKEDDRGNVLPSKRRSRGRIDGVSALLDVEATLVQPAAPSPLLFFVGGQG